MDQSYESEFTVFMDQFLKQHPEVAEEQMHRWHLEWDPKIRLPDEEDEVDLVPHVPMD
jgi:hypothetical protein